MTASHMHARVDTQQWEEVGAALQNCTIHVGALSCLKHRELCWSLKVDRYPTLMALNWPGAPPRGEDEPATKSIDKAGTVKVILQQVHHIFETKAADMTGDAAVPVAKTELEVDERTGGRGAADGRPGSTEGVACVHRVEDAVATIRMFLRNDVFTQGQNLSKERLGETPLGL